MSGNGNYMLESNMEWQATMEQALINYVNDINANAKERGAIGTLTNDPEHWHGYGIYTPEQLGQYLDNEYKHNLEKDERRNQ